MLKRKQTSTTALSEDNPYGISVGDLMAGLLLIFILILSSVMLRLEEKREKIDEREQVKKGIISKLMEEFSDEMEIEPQTGVIRIKEGVLFDLGKSDIKPEGRKFLRGFIPRYSKILLEDKIADKDVRSHLAQIIIEGHTDNRWEDDPEHAYEKNLELSLNRAYSVAEYIFSDEFGTPFPSKEGFKQLLSANGRSFVEPAAKPEEIEREKNQIKTNHPDWMEAEILRAIILAHNDTDEKCKRNRRVEFKFRLKDYDLDELLREKVEE